MASNTQQPTPDPGSLTLRTLAAQGQQLVEQMDKLNKHFESFQAATAVGQIRGQQKVLENQAATLPTGVSPNASRADQVAQAAQAVEDAQILKNNPYYRRGGWSQPGSDQPVAGVSENASVAPDTPRQTRQGLLRRLGKARNFTQFVEAANADADSGQRLPDDFSVPGMANMDLNEIRTTMPEIPRFGEWTMADKANLLRDWTGRLAIASQENAGGSPTRASSAFGNISGMANFVSENASSIYSARLLARGITSFGQGMAQQGANLGYDTSGGEITIPGTNIGFRPPWRLLPGVGSNAADEGWHQWLTTQRLSFRPGINRQQAQEMVQTLAQYGYSGDLNQNLATGSLAELIQHGQRPSDFIPLVDQAIRYNTTDVDSVTDALRSLGDVARATHQNLTEATQGMAAYAQAAQEAGSTYQQGMTSSNYFVGSTGMNAAFGAQMLQNPLVQGLGMQQFGILPSQIGLLPGGQVAGLTEQAAQMAMTLATPVGQDQIINTPGGQVTISGRQRQIAQAASSLGITPEQMTRLVDHPDQLRRAGQIQTMLQGQQQNIDDAQKARNWHWEANDRDSLSYEDRLRQAGIPLDATHGLSGDIDRDKALLGRKGYSKEQIDKFANADPGRHRVYEPYTPEQLGALTTLYDSKDNIQSTSEIMKQMDKLGISREDRSALIKLENSPQKFHDKAQQIITKQMDLFNQETPDVYIGFRGDAARYFQQLDKNGNPLKNSANAGGPPANSGATSNQTRPPALKPPGG